MLLKANLYKHQIEAVAFAKSKRYSILGLEMGLGKTLCALALAIEVKAKKILVVCPAFLKSNWLAEIDKFTEGLDVDIVSYASSKNVFESDVTYDFIIADECHYLKNHKAIRSFSFETIVSTHQPDYLVMLSGTPIKNRVGEFWNLLRLVYMGNSLPMFDQFKRKNQYFKWQYYFSNAVTQYFGNREVTKFEGLRNVEELKPIVNSARIRMKAKDVVSLPDQVEQDYVIKNKSKYDKEFSDLLKIDLQEKNETYMLIKKNNALAKSDFTAKIANEIMENGEKVVVFTDHIRSAERIARALGVKAISGAVSPSERSRQVESFESAREPLALVATIQSLSVGVNLTSACYMIFNDLPFVPADLDQAKKRIHRIGQDRKCFYYYVFISDLDQKLQKMIYSKRKLVEKI